MGPDTGTSAVPRQARFSDVCETSTMIERVFSGSSVSDNNPANVSVTLACGAGTYTEGNPNNVSEAAPFTWHVTGLSANTTCTATESPVPAGYTESDNCHIVALTPNGTASCTITNTLNSASFTVHKDFIPDNSANVRTS